MTAATATATLGSLRRRWVTAGAARPPNYLLLVATVGVLASQAEKPLDEAQQTSLYAGIGVGVALFGGGFLFAPGVPTAVVDACNAQTAR